MSTDAYARFVASLELDFDRWHDGDGYDLDALSQIDASRTKTTSAMHCAGVLCYLAGVGSEPFDWNLRPLLLRLGSDEPDDVREAAFRELCDLVKMSP
jgi:hypothetical protein